MNRRTLVLVLLLCLACMALGISFGAELFGCKEDRYGADHVFFRAEQCMSTRLEKGYSALECSRTVESR